MADDEDALHDNPRSPRREKVTKRETITERDAGEELGDKARPETSVPKPTELGENMSEDEKRAPADKKGQEGASDAGEVGEPDMKARREMFKRHETELNDHHALHLKALKDMQRRHAKELGSIFKMQPAEDNKPKKTPLHAAEE